VADVRAEVGAEGARAGLLGVGVAHDLAVHSNGVLSFEHLDEDRARRHVGDEVVEESFFFMDGVERAGLLRSEADHLRRHHFQPARLQILDDLPNLVMFDGVWLDDGKGLLDLELSFLGSGDGLFSEEGSGGKEESQKEFFHDLGKSSLDLKKKAISVFAFAVLSEP